MTALGQKVQGTGVQARSSCGVVYMELASPQSPQRRDEKHKRQTSGEWAECQESQVERAFIKPSHGEETHQTQPKGNKKTEL